MAQSSIVAKAIVLSVDGRILLLKRSRDDETRPGEWDFPGGGVDEEEDFKAALIRELQEEIHLSVKLKDADLVYAGTEPKDKDVSVTRLLFVVRTSSPTITLSHEHEAFEWMKLEEVLSNFQHHFYNPALRYLSKYQLL